MGYFLIKPVASGVKFDLRASNGEIIATSEVYKTAAACRKGIDSVIKNAAKAGIEDQTEETAPLSNPKFQLYRDKGGQFRFRLRSRNGAIIAISEAYTSKNACLDGIESVKNNIIFAQIAENSQNKY